MEWKPIETAPLMKPALFWHRSWRAPFPGKLNGDHGAVWIDTCEAKAQGRQEYASHWMPFPAPPSDGERK